METLGTRKCRALNRRTGLAVVPHYAASKIAWLLQQRTRGRRHRGTDLHAGTLDSYLAAHLAEGCEPVTDLTQASRTLLVNLGDHTWSPQNLDWFGIPEEVLPRVVPTIGLWGRLRKGALRPLPAGLPLTALAGDQQAALYGTGMRRKGQGKITFGSGAFLLLTAGSTLPVENPRVLRSIAWSQRRQATYLIETNVPSAGTVIDWLADLLGKPYGELLQRDARRGSLPERLQDLLFLPTFAGLGALAPGLPPAGRLDGLRDDSDGPQLATALAAGIGAALSMGLEQARRTLQCPVRQLMADGGGSRDRNFLQIQSEFLGRPLQRCKHAESTAFGAAALAWAGLGVEAPSLAALGKPISPRVPAKTMELLRARFRSGLRALEQERA
jgi:glycerol kinase